MRRKKATIFFLVFGICLVAAAVALNIGWILLNLREVALLVVGIIFFAVIITGLTLNTIFLVREIRRNEQHDAFMNAITHELKTPIASIKLYLETLKTREVAPAKQREFYDVMLADCGRLLGTVEEVLQASRMRDKGRPVSVEDVELRGLIKETAKTLCTQYHLPESIVRFTGNMEDAHVLGDRDELQTVFKNLLDNAIKYSGGEPKITVRMKQTGLPKRLEVYIKDNGIGISKGELKSIFKRFYRVGTGPAKDRKGSGLGLFIVRAMLQRHGGKIRAESRGEGEGTTFIIQLPLI